MCLSFLAGVQCSVLQEMVQIPGKLLHRCRLPWKNRPGAFDFGSLHVQNTNHCFLLQVNSPKGGPETKQVWELASQIRIVGLWALKKDLHVVSAAWRLKMALILLFSWFCVPDSHCFRFVSPAHGSGFNHQGWC